MNIQNYWKCTIAQDKEKIKEFFSKDAYINWHNTNEHFTVDEFIKANCEYPDKWDGKIERIETIGNLIITAVHVFAINKPLSFHVTSFIKIENDKIISIDEYWGDDGNPPKWRSDMKIGEKIKEKL